ncbi:hypothetical protein [Klebsiella pneumoniae]|uniref:hypothetical protein n=1 Tax=Klebsiella pneumoniae TaxID=573 RepID=UPI0024BEBC5A|nr:hypothetical protein [Klebsiella pneumoniae]
MPLIRFGFMVSGHGMLIVRLGFPTPFELQQGDGFLVKPETLFSLVDNPSTPTQWCECLAECSGNSLSFGGGDGEAGQYFSVAISSAIFLGARTVAFPLLRN